MKDNEIAAMPTESEELSTTAEPMTLTGDTTTTTNGASSSSCEQNVSNCGTKSSTMSHDPTPYVQRARVTRPAPPKPSCNPMQFVQIKPCNLFKTAQEQLKRAEEVKKVKEIKKEEPEEWQCNLDNWKSSRRKRVEHIIDRVVEVKKLELEEHDRARRKSKTFSEMMEERGDRRGRTKLATLAVYKDDESNDLSDLGIGTSSASGKSSLSEDYDNHSVMSDAADSEKAPFDLEDSNQEDIASTANRDYISSPGYDTSTSSTAPASSPDPCEYTYEGAIQDYKTRVSRNVAGFRSTTTLSSSSYSKDSTPERMTTSELASYQPRRGSKLEDRLMSFEVKSNENSTPKQRDLPKVDIVKRRELFEKEAPAATAKRLSGDFTASKTIRERLSSLEQRPLDVVVDVKKSNRLSGDITSIKDRLNCLERQTSETQKVANKMAADVQVPSLKDRLSSLQNAVTKEEVKRPVVLVDQHQLEMMKSEEMAKQLKRERDQLQLQDEEEVHDESALDTDREDSGIHTTDVSCSVSQTDEQAELVSIDAHHHINEDGLKEEEEEEEHEQSKEEPAAADLDLDLDVSVSLSLSESPSVSEQTLVYEVAAVSDLPGGDGFLFSRPDNKRSSVISLKGSRLKPFIFELAAEAEAEALAQCDSAGSEVSLITIVEASSLQDGQSQSRPKSRFLVSPVLESPQLVAATQKAIDDAPEGFQFPIRDEQLQMASNADALDAQNSFDTKMAPHVGSLVTQNSLGTQMAPHVGASYTLNSLDTKMAPHVGSLVTENSLETQMASHVGSLVTQNSFETQMAPLVGDSSTLNSHQTQMAPHINSNLGATPALRSQINQNRAQMAPNGSNIESACVNVKLARNDGSTSLESQIISPNSQNSKMARNKQFQSNYSNAEPQMAPNGRLEIFNSKSHIPTSPGSPKTNIPHYSPPKIAKSGVPFSPKLEGRKTFIPVVATAKPPRPNLDDLSRQQTVEEVICEKIDVATLPRDRIIPTPVVEVNKSDVARCDGKCPEDRTPVPYSDNPSKIPIPSTLYSQILASPTKSSPSSPQPPATPESPSSNYLIAHMEVVETKIKVTANEPSPPPQHPPTSPPINPKTHPNSKPKNIFDFLKRNFNSNSNSNSNTATGEEVDTFQAICVDNSTFYVPVDSGENLNKINPNEVNIEIIKTVTTGKIIEQADGTRDDDDLAGEINKLLDDEFSKLAVEGK